MPTSQHGGSEQETGPGDDIRGTTLGRAIALSGAASSPNMGYHSSPLVAFVKTLFNARLATWMPNLAGTLSLSDARDGRKRNEVSAVVGKLLGRSDDKDDYVYPSDGGRFDNLGLYEMLRRSCARVVVINAGQDHHDAYQDLRNTPRRAFINLRVVVDLNGTLDVGKHLGGSGWVRFRDLRPLGGRQAIGKILYVKSWLPSEAPTETNAFKGKNGAFPQRDAFSRPSSRCNSASLPPAWLTTSSWKVRSSGTNLSGSPDISITFQAC